MPSDSENTPPATCPACGYRGETALEPDGSAACPSCGEVWETAAEESGGPIKEATALPSRQEFEVLGHELIGQLSSGVYDEAPLEPSRLKSTDDEDAGGTEKTKKRKRPRRKPKQGVEWDAEKEKRRRVRRSAGRRRKAKVLKTLGAITGIALVCLTAYAAVIAFKRGRIDVAPPTETTGVQPINLETLASDEREAVVAQIETVYRGFLAADSLEGRRAFVREPERVGPLMEAYYRNRTIAPIQVREQPRGQRYRSRDTLAMTNLLMDDFSVRPIAVERVAGDEFKVDWESFVGHCEVPWEKMAEARPIEPFLVRAMVSLGHERSDVFARDQWRCWQLENRGSDQRIYGYTRRGSSTETEIALALKTAANGSTGQQRVPMAIDLVFPDDGGGSDAPHAEIVTVHTLGWVLIDSGAK